MQDEDLAAAHQALEEARARLEATLLAERQETRRLRVAQDELSRKCEALQSSNEQLLQELEGAHTIQRTHKHLLEERKKDHLIHAQMMRDVSVAAEGEKKRWDEEKAILIERLAMYGDFENI